MRSRLLLLSFGLCLPCFSQSNDTDQSLLEKTKALYDTPFRRGLISFDCAIQFDLKQHLKDNLAPAAAATGPLFDLIEPIRYRVFVDGSGAIVSAQPKLPDLSKVPHANDAEESNRNLMQFGLGNWVPYAYGELLPLGPTKYKFEKTPIGYTLSMHGDNLESVLRLDRDLHLISGTVEKPMHIEMTQNFIKGPDGLVLAASSTNTEHAGIVNYQYTYQAIDGFQIPDSIILTSPQGITLRYKLTDCKAQHGIVVKVKVESPAKH
jgi:hypothetical protein